MPAWVHDRAEHIKEKNPDMPESESWAIATNQYKAKKSKPSSKSKSSSIDLAFLDSFVDEVIKISASMMGVADVTKGIKNSTLSTKPKLVSKGIPSALETSSNKDPISSARAIPPPPVLS